MVAIEEIPRLMGEHHWMYGRRLMLHWFGTPAAVAPRYGPPVTDFIKMDWVLGYRRARQAFDRLVADRVWINEAARKEIAAMLGRKGFLQGYRGTQTFGDLDQPVPALDADYINHRAVTGYQLDDLTAALGAFPFRVVVSGTVAPAEARGEVGHDVTIGEVGVYLRDSYDFEGDQFLGYWHYDGRVGMMYFKDATPILNSDYRKWRARTGKGGDFLIYSDLKRFVPRGDDKFNTWEYYERFR